MSVDAQIQKLRKQYPGSHVRGACPHSGSHRRSTAAGFRRTRSARSRTRSTLTPAYCLSIASFYDQYYLEPIGRTHVEVCTNVSCALAGAQQVVEAFERELGVSAGSTSEDGAYTLGTIECLGGCGWATVVAIDNRHRLRVQADDVPGIVEELRSDA